MTHNKERPADSPRRPEGGVPSASGRPASSRRFESADLFAGADEVFIQHRGREYRLRITQNGKLILNA